MPVHDLGYRKWEGVLNSPYFRWWVVAQTGIRLSWKNPWLRRLLLAAWLPAVWLSVGIFMFEQAMEDPTSRNEAKWFIQRLPNADVLSFVDLGNVSMFDDVAKWRHSIWALILHTFFRYPQGMLMVLVVGIIAPPLIARDFRSRAFLLYFSRPLTRFEYLLGKAVTVWVYLSIITTLPALALYILGVLLSPDISVLSYTWDLPFRIIAASTVLMVPTTAIALFFSAIAQQSRYAGFAWFAIWVFGWVIYGSVAAPSTFQSGTVHSGWSLVSMYHLLGNVQTWIFGLPQDPWIAGASVIILGIITFICFAWLLKLVSAPMRV